MAGVRKYIHTGPMTANTALQTLDQRTVTGRGSEPAVHAAACNAPHLPVVADSLPTIMKRPAHTSHLTRLLIF
jgi:hypothetical protein